jgi:hypothetical protein
MDNMVRYRQEIQFVALPRTLQDSIMIVRFLGFDYVWIDCLCIIQDDKADWAREASRMADVYWNAALSIAASSSMYVKFVRLLHTEVLLICAYKHWATHLL